MSKVYLDTETCGLHSMMVLLQYAEEDGPIQLHEVWRRPIRETLRLIEWLCEHTVVGFNLSFDWFHIAKTYTVFRLATRTGFRGSTSTRSPCWSRRGKTGRASSRPAPWT